MRTRVELKQDAKAQLQGKKGTAAIMFLILFMIQVIPNIVKLLVGESLILGIVRVVVMIYSSLLGIGMIKFYLSVRRNQQVSAGMLFSGCEYYLKGFLISLLVGLVTVVGTILFIVPGIIFAYMYSQSLTIYIDNPEMGIIESMKTSRLAMSGHKGDLFILQLSFIGWSILSLFTLGILLLYVYPYYQTTLINFYTDVMEEYKGVNIA